MFFIELPLEEFISTHKEELILCLVWKSVEHTSLHPHPTTPSCGVNWHLVIFSLAINIGFGLLSHEADTILCLSLFRSHHALPVAPRIASPFSFYDTLSVSQSHGGNVSHSGKYVTTRHMITCFSAMQ